MCDVTHSFVWHDSYTHVTWLNNSRDMTHQYAWHDLFIRKHLMPWVSISPLLLHIPTWLVHSSDMTHRHACHNSFIRVTRLIYRQAPHALSIRGLLITAHTSVTHSYEWHRTSDMTPRHAWYNSFIRVSTQLVSTQLLSTQLVSTQLVSTQLWHDSFIRKHLMPCVSAGSLFPQIATCQKGSRWSRLANGSINCSASLSPIMHIPVSKVICAWNI